MPEAITFDELVEHGLAHTKEIVDGIPLCFIYKGWTLTHKKYHPGIFTVNDNCYIIPRGNGIDYFAQGDMLVDDGDLLKVEHHAREA